MKRSLNQAGFSAVEILMVVVVIGVIAGISLMVHSRGMGTSTTTSSASKTNGTAGAVKSEATVSQAPAAINSTSDLDKAAATLDQNDPTPSNTSDSNQLDGQANGL